MNGSAIIPGARYKDAHAAIDWLCKVFGFAKHAVYEGPNNTVAHAQLTLGGGMFMLGSEVKGREILEKTMTTLEETDGRETLGLYLVIADIDAVYERVKAAGAVIVQELKEPEHGGKDFACKDIEGHIWWVGSYNQWETK